MAECATRESTPRVSMNILSRVNLNCKLDLGHIVRHAINAEYKDGRVTMRIREPRTTALIFSSGKLVCTGAQSEQESRRATMKYVRIIQKLGFNAKWLDFEILNIMGYCDVKFPIRLEMLNLVYRQFSSYEPELYTSLIYDMANPKIKIDIHGCGKLVFAGAKNRQELNEAFDNIYPILIRFKKQLSM